MAITKYHFGYYVGTPEILRYFISRIKREFSFSIAPSAKYILLNDRIGPRQSLFQ